LTAFPIPFTNVAPAVLTFSAASHTAPNVIAGTNTKASATLVLVLKKGLPDSRC
jgi:hypothetical protein